MTTPYLRHWILPVTLFFSLIPSSYASRWMSPCAVDCSSALSGDWSYLHSLDRLNACKETTVFHANLYNPIQSPDTHVYLQACTISASNSTSSPKSVSRRAVALDSTVGCNDGAEVKQEEFDLRVLTQGGSTSEHQANIHASLSSISDVMSHDSNCDTTILFAKSGSAVVGVYFGASIQKGSAIGLLDQFAAHLESNSDNGGEQVSMELCGEKRPSHHMAGIMVDNRGNVSAVQDGLRQWSDGKCHQGFEEESKMTEVKIGFLPVLSIPLPKSSGNASPESQQESQQEGQKEERSLTPRAECKPIKAVDGDGCWTLSQSCGITQAEFQKRNPSIPSDCSGILPGEYYCCTEGSLPDFSPKPNADGTCSVYQANDDTRCYLLEAEFRIPKGKIEEYNKETWGWTGCSGIQPGMMMCLSPGEPPMPKIDEEANCGPQKKGTTRPKPGTDLETLNPCPLNACCSGWGRCGTTKEFCTPTPADSGAPGAFKPGTNGCFSNCGTDIVNNDDGPDEFARLAYFEAWNNERNCSTLDADDIPDHFTHIHYAFVDITPDFVPDPSKNQDQFDKFKKRNNWKKIPSFGGWSFSTELGTYKVFRDGVLPPNRERFATNIVNFVVSNGLDGVDFDWEYPGETDMPVIPPDGPEKGQDYLEFLKLVRQKLPKEKTLSIAAPASYWYLRAFPISDMIKVLDYIIYMTYDLHGQWDYANPWASPGCAPEGEIRGNCLRSHINMTETENALAMITKAGAPSKKVFVGISSYGRSFKMEQPGCTGTQCRFVGLGEEHESAAQPGRCTDTRGYIGEWEIRNIISRYQGGISMGNTTDVQTFRRYYDKESDSDILIYDGTDWVAWMDRETKLRRWIKYLGWNFGGTSDWAIDLSGGHDSMAEGDRIDKFEEEGDWTPCDYDKSFQSLEDLEKNGADLDPLCKAIESLDLLGNMLNDAIDRYDDVNNGYDDKFKYYEKATKAQVEYNIDECMKWRDGACNKHFTCSWNEGGREMQKGKCNTMSASDPSLREKWTVVYTLDEKEGFFKTLEENYGIADTWVKFGDKSKELGCASGSGGHGPPVGNRTKDPIERVGPCRSNEVHWKGIPMRDDNMKVPNPKEVVDAAKSNATEVLSAIAAQELDLLYGQWAGPDNEAVEVISMPVLMAVQAVESMDKVKEIGADIEEEERKKKEKEIITWVLTGVFFLIPFVGEAAGALGWASATIVRMTALIGLLGDAALTTVDIIENPEAAPLAALGLLIPGGVGRTPKNVGSVFRKKKELGVSGLAKLGDVFKRNDEMIQNIVNVCKR